MPEAFAIVLLPDAVALLLVERAVAVAVLYLILLQEPISTSLEPADSRNSVRGMIHTIIEVL